MAAKKTDNLDELGIKILNCMLLGYSNRDIVNELDKPLSTVQRRTRQLIQAGLIKIRYELDYKTFGLKKGYLHIYLKNGHPHQVAEKVATLEHILSVSVHIGNSDIVAEYVCNDAIELLEMMGRLKKLEAVERIVWSEEVATFTPTKSLLSIINKPNQTRRLAFS